MTVTHERGDANRPVQGQHLCRVTVLARSVQVDIALPVDVPVSLLVPGVVDLVGRGAVVQPSAAAWVLSRVGTEPLSPTTTLAESAVRDGELLVLSTVNDAAPPPLFDDMMDSVARSGRRDSAPWSAATARIVASAFAFTGVLVACATVLLGPIDAGTVGRPDRTTASVVTAVAVTILAAGIVASRVYADRGVSIVLCASAIPLAFTSGVLFVPGAPGAAHIVLGGTFAAAVALLALRLADVGTALFTGISIAAILAVVGSSVPMYLDVSTSAVGAVAVAVGFVGLAMAPRISMMQARLPLPPVPTAGAPLDGEPELDLTALATLDESARRARRFLSGLVGAATTVVVVGAVVAVASTASPNQNPWPAVALALTSALVLTLRARTYAGAQHALPLMIGGLALLAALYLGAVAVYPDHRLPLFGVAVAGGCAALIFGIGIPGRTFSPVLRRSSEIAEYLAIASVLPLVCWVCGLYAAVRGL